MPKCLRILSAAGAMTLTVAAVSWPPTAEARPQYLEAFEEQYEHLAEKIESTKCGVCHVGSSKKDRNDYGKALADMLGSKNEKDMSVFKDALAKVEKESSSVDGKTWGEVLKEELPK